MTCHFNLRHMISVHVSALFKQTFHYGGNQYLSVITVPKNMTSTYISHDFSTVHISKDFSLRNQKSRKKCRRTKRYCMQKNTLDWRKIKMVNAPLRIQQIIHLTRLDCSSFRTWFGKFSDMIEEKQITIENRKADKVQRTKQKKKNVQKTLVRN